MTRRHASPGLAAALPRFALLAIALLAPLAAMQVLAGAPGSFIEDSRKLASGAAGIGLEGQLPSLLQSRVRRLRASGQSADRYDQRRCSKPAAAHLRCLQCRALRARRR